MFGLGFRSVASAVGALRGWTRLRQRVGCLALAAATLVAACGGGAGLEVSATPTPLPTTQAPAPATPTPTPRAVPTPRLAPTPTPTPRPASPDAQTRPLGTISTVAGTGEPGFGGDGGPATSALLLDPKRVAVDGPENLFIADTRNNRVRRVDALTGIITTVAGSGRAGSGGDGGPATSASLFEPEGMAVDAAGNLFIADTDNGIRRVDAETGFITTVAGNGEYGYSGDGGPATRAMLMLAVGVALDSAGNLFFSDLDNHRVRRVDARTGIITTVAGTGRSGFTPDGAPAAEAMLDGPHGLGVDSGGNLFIAEFGNHRVRKVEAATGLMITVAGTGEQGFGGDGGPAAEARLASPMGIAVDGPGNLFIADWANDRIRSVDAETGVITTVAGGGQDFSGEGPADSVALSGPSGVAVDANGNLFIAVWGNNRVSVVKMP